MPVTNWASPASATLVSGGGSGVGNVLTQNGTIFSWGGSGGSPVIRTTNYGFSDLPDDATIDGFEVGIYASEIGGGNAYVDELYLQKVAGTVGSGTNQGGTTAGFLTPNTFQWMTLGGSTNKFGWSWTAAEAKASTFSLQSRHRNTDGKYSPDLSIDAYRMRVYYTAATTTTTTTTTTTSTTTSTTTTTTTTAAPTTTTTTSTTTSTTTTSCRDNYPRFGLYTWIPGCAPINWRNSRFKRAQ